MQRNVYLLSLLATVVLLLSLPALAGAHIQPAACGGSRASLSMWEDPGTGDVFSAQLRGSTVAEVFSAGPGQKSATWVSGRMFGTIPSLGPVMVRISDDNESFADIVSGSGGEPFYPALASQTLYWEIDVLDGNGGVSRTLINLQPMAIEATIQSIPPYGTPFPIDDDVDFYDVTDLSTPVIRVLGGQSLGILEDVGGLDVLVVSEQIDFKTGTFSITVNIVNTSGVPQTIHWYATGLHSAQIQGADEGLDVPLGQQLTVALSGTFNPAELDAGLAVHATSVPGTNTLAEGRVLLHFQ